VKYFGHTEVVLDSGVYKAIVIEHVAGYSSKDRKVIRYIERNRTYAEIEYTLQMMLVLGIIPFDFQFIVKADGSIKVIDMDMYETFNTLEENGLTENGAMRVRTKLSIRGFDQRPIFTPSQFWNPGMLPEPVPSSIFSGMYF